MSSSLSLTLVLEKDDLAVYSVKIPTGGKDFFALPPQENITGRFGLLLTSGKDHETVKQQLYRSTFYPEVAVPLYNTSGVKYNSIFFKGLGTNNLHGNAPQFLHQVILPPPGDVDTLYLFWTVYLAYHEVSCLGEELIQQDLEKFLKSRPPYRIVIIVNDYTCPPGCERIYHDTFGLENVIHTGKKESVRFFMEKYFGYKVPIGPQSFELVHEEKGSEILNVLSNDSSCVTTIRRGNRFQVTLTVKNPELLSTIFVILIKKGDSPVSKFLEAYKALSSTVEEISGVDTKKDDLMEKIVRFMNEYRRDLYNKIGPFLQPQQNGYGFSRAGGGMSSSFDNNYLMTASSLPFAHSS